jgi:hypothetical protein
VVRAAGLYCAYWRRVFEKPKIVLPGDPIPPVLRARCQMDTWGTTRPSSSAADDLYLLAVLNSPLMWWHNWRYLPHMKDEALSPVGFLDGGAPHRRTDHCHSRGGCRDRRPPTDRHHRPASSKLSAPLLDWLRMEYAIEKPGQKLAGPDRTRLRRPGLRSEAHCAAKSCRSPPLECKACATNTPAPSNPPAPSPPKRCSWSAPSTTSSTKPTP